METLIELLEDQIDSLNKDEKSIDENLDFLGKSMDAIILSRKDTFKEKISRAYEQKDREVDQLNMKIMELEGKEDSFAQTADERDQLLLENRLLSSQL